MNRLAVLEKHLSTPIISSHNTSDLDSDIDLTPLPKQRYVIRDLEEDDFEKGFPNILNELTTVGEITQDEFIAQFDLMSENKATYYVRVIEDSETQKIIGSATLLVELKFIRNCGKCGHIEDVVVNSSVRGNNLGKLIIDDLLKLAEQLGCYKVILDCNEGNVAFYEKCGFHKTEIMMRYPKK